MPKITDALQDVPELEDVNSDAADSGLEVALKIDRATAARLGITTTQIDNTLYDAFGQRQVSTIYNDLNQYHVVMGVAPEFWQSPETLKDIYVSTSGGSISGHPGHRHRRRHDGDRRSTAPDRRRRRGRRGAQPAAQRADQQRARRRLDRRLGHARRSRRWCRSRPSASFGPGTTPLAINHQGPFVATTFSFNLPPGESLGQATAAIQRTMAQIACRRSRCTASSPAPPRCSSNRCRSEPLLILAAILDGLYRAGRSL